MQYPSKYAALENIFGLKYQKLSRIFNTGIDYLYAVFSSRLAFERVMIVGRHQLYVEAVWRKSAGLIGNCFGFLDATLHKCCRPIWFQEVMFNGHKRVHGMKWQSLTLPDGMIGSIYGPVEGRRHDTTVLRFSGLIDSLQVYLPGLCVYADGGYPLAEYLLAPFKL